MKILRKYIIKEFAGPFAYTICLSCIVYLIYEFFFRIHEFLTYHASLLFIMQYLSIQLPLWIKDSLPISCLAAVILALRRLSRDGEITAMKATGINIYSAVLPLVLAGLLLSFFGMYLNTRLVPETYAKRSMYLRVKLQGLKEDPERKLYNLVFSGANGEKFTIYYYNFEEKKMEEVAIDYISKKFVLEKQVKAKEMVWQKDRWILRDGIERYFADNGREISKELKFGEKELIIPDEPNDFLPSAPDDDEMSQDELRGEIHRLITHGQAHQKQLVRYYYRFAYPFASFVVTLLAIPFCIGMTGDKLKQMLSIAFIVSVCFIYYIVLNVGRAFGSAGSLPPALGAWFGNIVFVFVAVILFAKMRR